MEKKLRRKQIENFMVVQYIVNMKKNGQEDIKREINHVSLFLTK